MQREEAVKNFCEFRIRVYLNHYNSAFRVFGPPVEKGGYMTPPEGPEGPHGDLVAAYQLTGTHIPVLPRDAKGGMKAIDAWIKEIENDFKVVKLFPDS